MVWLGRDIVRADGIPAGSAAAIKGAHIRDRTGDLSLTKTVLYLLSYVGRRPSLPECNRSARTAGPSVAAVDRARRAITGAGEGT